MALAVLAVAMALVVLTATLSALLEQDGWSEATAAAGVAATVVAAAVLLGTASGWTNGTRMSLAAVATAVVSMGAIALVIVTYAGGIGDAGVSGDAVTTSNGSTDEGAALSQQVSNNDLQPPGYAHDLGTHPPYAQFMSMDTPTVLRSSPGGTLLPEEVPVLKEQLAAARTFAEDHNTFEKATADGYYNTTNDVPFMGAHLINTQYLTDGVFDASKPEGLLFSKKGNTNGEWQLVGVWYLLIPGLNGEGVTTTIPPGGFAGNLDLWHEHHGLCTRAGIISENNTAEGCATDNGRWIGDLRWMMHVWVYPEGADNSDGVFAYLNSDLWRMQQNVRAAP